MLDKKVRLELLHESKEIFRGIEKLSRDVAIRMIKVRGFKNKYKELFQKM